MDGQRALEDRFYETHLAPESLLRIASEVCRAGGQVYGALFATTQPLRTLVERLKGRLARQGVCEVSRQSPYVVGLTKRVRRGRMAGEWTAKVVVWEDSESSIVHLLSCQARELFEAVASTVHWCLVPELCRPYLRTGEMRAALNQVARVNRRSCIRVREYTSRSLIDDVDSAKRVSTTREWTDEDYVVVFQKMFEERRWLTSVKLEVRGPMTTTARIWRDSRFCCQEGFPLFSRVLLPELKRVLVRGRSLFENRGRSTSPTGMSRPLRIVYTEDVFSQAAQLKRLRRTLDSLRDSALSVMHPNPYFHATLLDYADGSSYQLWVTTPSSILVVPKKKATMESMQRLCNHICNEFEEGEIEEFGA